MRYKRDSDQGLAQKIILSTYRSLQKKKPENTIVIYASLTEYRRAFDSVNHQKLWDIMPKLSTPTLIVKVFIALYRDQQTAVRIEKDLTEWFEVNKEVRQGCFLSPLCFNLYTEYIIARQLRYTCHKE